MLDLLDHLFILVIVFLVAFGFLSGVLIRVLWDNCDRVMRRFGGGS